ncbi:MAG: S8 family serine peptidase, partial [Bdellovibrionales bacterium]|nr:S8 family serine peptidase [Bdellovibrionales bacterium]
QEVFFSPFLRYKPDAYGQYSIVVIVQDDRQVCAFSSFEFIVTGNKPYLGTREKFGSRLDILDKNLFSHRSEIRADQALEISQNKGKGVIIAVIDSGVNYNHPAQINNIWLNKKEVANNNIDDDNNGKIDDLIGYDFVNDDAFPFDDQGHGSHVSGLIASEYFGIAPHSLIMPLKALSPKGGDIGSIVGAIYYAVDQGAHILNLSLGSYGPPHPHLVEAINYAESKNVLVVAASGNGDPNSGAGLDTDKFPNFPSAFDNKNIISVAAKDSQHLLAPYSNYGMNSVDIAAPGGNPPDELLNSCFLENPSNILFTGMAGTSMAAPLVSGTLALMLSDSPKLSIDEVKNILLTSGRVAPGLEKLTVSGRYLDTLEALKKSQVY